MTLDLYIVGSIHIDSYHYKSKKGNSNRQKEVQYTVNHYPPGNCPISPPVNGTFESMIWLLFPFGGIWTSSWRVSLVSALPSKSGMDLSPILTSKSTFSAQRSKSTITQRGTCLPAPVSEKNLERVEIVVIEKAHMLIFPMVQTSYYGEWSSSV